MAKTAPSALKLIPLMAGLFAQITWARGDSREEGRRIATFSMNVTNEKGEALFAYNSLSLLDSVDDDGVGYIDIGSMSSLGNKDQRIYAITFYPGRRNPNNTNRKNQEAEYRRITEALAKGVHEFIQERDEGNDRRRQIRENAQPSPIARQLKQAIVNRTAPAHSSND